jgi:hypothetical protein
MRGLRKRYRVPIFAAFVAALVVPVGYALSLETAPAVGNVRYSVVRPFAAAVMAPVTHRGDDRLGNQTASPVYDAAKLFGVGSILFGLAAALRKPSER